MGRNVFGSIALAATLVCALTPGFAQAPANLAQPPASARTWTILSSAGPHGRESVWTGEDGAVWSRQSILLRGLVTEIDQRLQKDASGRVTSIVVRGVTPFGPADETFEIREDRARWRTPADSGEAAVSDAIYSTFGGTVNAAAEFIGELMRAPDHARKLYPSGEARLERLTTHVVRKGAEAKTLTAWAITGLAWYPLVYWLDENGQFFGYADWLSWLPQGWEHVESELAAAQTEALKARAQTLAAQIGRRPAVPVVFQDVRLYDADARAFREHMTVVVEGEQIVAVGPADGTAAPGHAEIIQGAGRTLVPGLWDSHMHFADDTTGPLLLSLGVTSVRDPGNRAADLEARMARIQRGELLGPRVLASLLIDGRGERSAQAAMTASTLPEALAHVRYAKEHGFTGIKIYGSIRPEWVRPMAREAHRLGLHVSGHIPAGMRPREAVRAGYDEITHINFVFMQAMPDAVVRDSNGMKRFYGPAEFAADVDLARTPMRPFLDELARRRTVVDTTVVAFEGLLTTNPGEPHPGIAPFLGALPPQAERWARAGGAAPPPNVSRERMRASFARMRDSIAELHRRDITILAGTDGTGLELVRELELYVQAGLTPAEALVNATIVPARVFGLADRTGSIAAGKLAELALIDGDPSSQIGDLRHVAYVMRDGRLMEAQALRAALGLGAPPRK